MSFVLKPDASGEILEVRFTGTIGGQNLREMSTQAIAWQKRSGITRFLIDADGWDLVASVVDIYDITARQYWQEDLDPRSRIAIVLPKSDSARQGAQFYEDACRNRGWNARVHPDRESAIAWLRGG